MTPTPIIRNDEDFWNTLFGFLFVFLFLMLCLWLSQEGVVPRSMGIFDFSLVALATYRLIRLFTYDKITDSIRTFFRTRETGFARSVHSLLVCSWCTGIWMSLAILTIYYAAAYGWLFILLLAVSWAASFVQIVTNGIIRYAEKSIVQKELLEKSVRNPSDQPSGNRKWWSDYL